MNTNKQTNKNEIRKNIITLFDIDKLPENKQEETVSRIGKIILQSVLVRILPTLKEEELSQYEKLVENNTEQDVLFDFFFEKVPFFLQIVAEESENFIKESAEVLEQTN